MTLRTKLLLAFAALALGVFALRGPLTDLYDQTMRAGSPSMGQSSNDTGWREVTAKSRTLRDAYAAELVRYRLPPDRRALLALALRAGSAEPAAAEMTAAGWQVALGDGRTAPLPDLASFADLLALVRESMPAAPAAAALEGADDPLPFDAPALIQRLRSMDAKRAVEPAARVFAARCYARLAFMAGARLAPADQLRARALLALVEAQAASGGRMAFEESMLAMSMGYSAHALELVATTPLPAAWSAYLRRDDAALETAAGRGDAEGMSDLLWLDRLAELDDMPRWQRQFDRRFAATPSRQLPALLTGLQLSSFSLRYAISDWLPVHVLSEVSGAKRGTLHELAALIDSESLELVATASAAIGQRLGARPQAVFSRLAESGVAAWGGVEGTGLDRAALEGYYASLVAHALYDRGRLIAKSRGSKLESDLYALQLGGEDPRAQAFRTWFVDYAALKFGEGDVAVVRVDVPSYLVIGAEAYVDVIDQVFGYLTPAAGQEREHVERFARLVDARPTMRSELADMLEGRLYRAHDSMRLYESAVAVDPRDRYYAAAWIAVVRGRGDALAALVSDPKQGLEARRSALYALRDQADPQVVAAVRAGFESLVRERPTDDDVHRAYARWLSKRKDYAALLDVAKRWRFAPGARNDQFAQDDADLYTARAVLELGDPAASRRIADPLVEGQYGFAYGVAFDAARAQGELDRMLELGRAAHDRYPNTKWIALMFAEALWATRHAGEAAKLLAELRPGLTPQEHADDFAPPFERQFRDDEAAATAAFDAYRDALARPDLAAGVAVGLHRLGNDRLAFALNQRIHSHGVDEVEIAMLDYAYAQGFGEPERGLASMRARVPQGMESAIMQIAYDQRRYELLWGEIPTSFSDDEVRWTWQFRAMAWAADGVRDAGQRAKLDEALAAGSGDRVVESSRMLLGLDPDEPLLARPMAQRDLCETAYLFAVKRLAAGEVEEGERWLQVVLNTGDYHVGEWRWARVWAGAIASVGADRERLIARRANLRPAVNAALVSGEPWLR